VIVCRGCGARLVVQLGQLEAVECISCGLDYDPRSGELLPVCEGLIPPRRPRVTRAR
jgi:hypothetical protein